MTYSTIFNGKINRFKLFGKITLRYNKNKKEKTK